MDTQFSKSTRTELLTALRESLCEKAAGFSLRLQTLQNTTDTVAAG